MKNLSRAKCTREHGASSLLLEKRWKGQKCVYYITRARSKERTYIFVCRGQPQNTCNICWKHFRSKSHQYLKMFLCLIIKFIIYIYIFIYTSGAIRSQSVLFPLSPICFSCTLYTYDKVQVFSILDIREKNTNTI